MDITLEFSNKIEFILNELTEFGQDVGGFCDSPIMRLLPRANYQVAISELLDLLDIPVK